MKRLKLFFACLLMAVLSIGQMWGEEALYKTASFAKANCTKNSTYTGSLTCTVGTDSWTAAYAANNNGGWDYIKMGGKRPSSGGTTVHTGTIITSASYSDAITKVVVNGSLDRGSVSAKLIYASNSDFTSDKVESNALTAFTDGKMTFTIASPVANRYYKLEFVCTNGTTTNGVISISSVEYYMETGGTPTCANPTFTPAAGAVLSGTTVAISCATDGATIHYTTDGTEPTASSPTYSSAITIDAAKTIKAIAVKSGLSNSSVASAAYTVLTPLTTMDQIFDAATSAGSTPTTVAITFNNWVVTGVKNSNAYVTDGTKGFIVYTSSHGFQVGDILSGTAVCKVQLYNGSAELTELTASKVTVNTGGSVSPVVLDAEGIATLTGANTGSVIKISGECTYESSKYYIAGVQLYNQLYSFSVSAGTNYECTGVYVQHNTTKEILPRSAADIVAQTSVANPTFSPAAGEYTEVKNVTLSCATDGATIYYTTDGTNPTNESTVYSSAIEVGASMTIKAIAYKGENHSEVVSAAYTINLPLPEHTFQVTHHFSTGEGFEFPTGWGGSYAEHEIAYTDDKVHFVSASHQSGTITDRPVVKEGAISLILTNSKKLISAVRFDYSQWSAKVPTLTMKYSTDGGDTYSNFNPVVSTTNFALQVLDMPEGVNAIQVVGTADKQVGLTSIAFDLVNKPVVTKTVTITTPSNGTLVVKNGDDAIASGDAIEVNTVLTIEATPAEGYKLTEVTVNGSAYAEETLTLTENVTIAATFEENLAPEVETYILSEAGVETSHLVSGMRVGDKVNLPLTAAECSKVFRGWDANAECATAPTYAPGEEYELALNNKLYAVYATPGDNAATELFATSSLGSTNEVTDGYTVSAVAGAQSGYYQDGGSVGNKRYVQVMVSNTETQIIPAQPSAITVTANIGGGSTNDNLTNPVYAVLLNAAGEEIGDPVALTSAIEVQTGKAYTENLPTANYANVRGVRIYHVKENKGSSGYNVRYYAISLSYSAESYSDYSTDCQAAVATPTFSPVAGIYTEAQNVTITSETEGVTIYYTTNGDDPTTSSTLYNGAVEVGESMTLKAIAVKSGMTNSAIASAAYTINLPLSTMDQIFAAATAAGNTATDVNIAFGNWVVSGVSTNGKNVFVTDGTKGFIIFDSGASMGFAVGDVLSGTAACKVQLYNGAAELTTLSSTTEGLNVATGGTVTPEVKAISALSGINTGAAVTINSVQFDGEYLSDGANEIKPYNSLFAYEALENGKYYNITGIYQQFGNTTKEILPRSAADIDEVDLDDPELSYSPASVSLEVGQALSAPTFNNPHTLSPITYAVSGDAVATVTNEGVIALVENATGTAVITASFAGNAQYAAGNATFTITVSEPVDAKNVVVLAEYDSKFYALTTNVSNKTAAAVVVEKDGDKIVVASAEDKAAIQWKKITDGDNTTFQDADDSYLKGTSGGGDLTLVTTVCNWSWDGTNNCYAIGSRSFIYRESANGFKNYSIGNAGTSDYSAIAEVIEIDPENIVISSKVDPELAYTPNELEIAAEDVASWSAPVLGYVDGFDGLAAITYQSNNESVATVTDGGAIALAGGYGTATITATFGGNTNYLAGSATYTITVNTPVPVPTGTTYTKVTSTENITDGEYLIVYEGDATHAAMAFNGSLDNIDQSMVGVAVTINEGVIAGTTAIDAATFTIDVTAGTLQSASGYYIGRETYDNGMDKSTETAYTNTFAISEGKAVITGAGNCTLRYNYASDQLRFRYYKSGQQAIQLYKKDTPEPPTPSYTTVRYDLNAGWYYTMCLDKAVTAVQGASIWRVLSKAANGLDVILEEVIGTLDAGRPYIFFATASTLQVAYTGDAVLTPLTEGNNGLIGSFSQTEIAQSPNNFIIYNNALYYVNSDYVYVGAYRAYLDMNGVPAYNSNNEPQQGAPRRRVTMAVHGEQTVTGIDALNAAETPVKVMINGQIFILRGEKMYDATGRLVK